VLILIRFRLKEIRRFRFCLLLYPFVRFIQNRDVTNEVRLYHNSGYEAKGLESDDSIADSPDADSKLLEKVTNYQSTLFP
jgi:hypothetical protein